MDDDQSKKPINDIMGQSPGPVGPTPNFGLGTNPVQPSSFGSLSPSQDRNDPLSQGGGDDKPPIDKTKTIDHDGQNPILDSPLFMGGVSASGSELDLIKRDALSQLSPLLNKLDQTPEEKYRTLMMVIQASDNQALIKDAYEAANRIEDESKKAEALLGIVNEINYFSKKNGQAQNNN